MCGRARCALAPARVAAAADVPQHRWQDADSFTPSHNISPGGHLPVLRNEGCDGSQRKLHTMRWGLVPAFHKHGERLDFFRMFNARSETVDSKSIFKRLLPHRRCVVMVQGFYEWKKQGAAMKQPYYVHIGEADEAVMFLAGLYDTYTDPDGTEMYSVTILTTDASSRIAWLHDRMPAILCSPKQVSAWLGDDGASASLDKDAAAAHAAQVLHQVAAPYTQEDLLWHPVTTAMSNPRYNQPDTAVDMRKKQSAITSFFKVSPRKAAGAGQAAAPSSSTSSAAAAAAATPPGVQRQHQKATAVQAAGAAEAAGEVRNPDETDAAAEPAAKRHKH